MERLIAYGTVVGLSMMKLVLGPIAARGFGLNPLESVVCSALGMIATALVIGTVGDRVRAFVASMRGDDPAAPDAGRRVPPRVRAAFERYGVIGIAVLTPLLLSPPGGALAAVALGVPRTRMMFAMSVAAFIGATVYTVAIYAFGEVLVARGILDPID